MMTLDCAVASEVVDGISDAIGQPLPLVSFSTIMREELPPVEWDVESVIARGERAIFYGEWSSLKSWVALDLALHLAAGKPWLDKFPVPKARRVLYIDEEMSARTLRRRIKRLGMGMKLDTDDIPFQALSRYGVTLNAPGVERLVEGLNASAFKPDVVVIDTMRRVLVGNEKEPQDITQFWKHVDLLVKQDTTVIVLHHMRKRRSKSESARDRASGTTDIPAGADANIAVERNPADRDVVTLVFLKSREGEEAEDCVIRLNDHGEKEGPVDFEFMGTPKECRKAVNEANVRVDTLVAFVHDRGTARTGEIAAHLVAKFGGSDRTAERDLKRASKSGQIISAGGHGVWRVPAA